MSPRRADAELLAATAMWGVSFVVLKQSLAASTPLAFVALRFAIGALVLLPFAPSPWRWTRGELRDGVLLAVLFVTGFATQMVGMQYTTPSRSAFIIASSSVIAPLIAVVVVRERPHALLVAALAVAAVGVYLLTAPDAGGLNRGDLWTLVTAVAFGGQIFAASALGPRHDPRRLALLQITLTAAGAGLATVVLEDARVSWTPALFAGLGYAAVIATALALLLQLRAQRQMTATRASILFCAEPLFAATAAWWWLGETLSATQWAGGALVLAAMVLVEVPRRPAG